MSSISWVTALLSSRAHNNLLQASSAYACLLQTQELRQGQESSGMMDSDDDSEDSGPDTAEKNAAEGIHLGCTSTRRSLASEIFRAEATSYRRSE